MSAADTMTTVASAIITTFDAMGTTASAIITTFDAMGTTASTISTTHGAISTALGAISPAQPYGPQVEQIRAAGTIGFASVVEVASMACAAAGLVAGGLVLTVRGRWRLALGVALDFWLAAGLLRLSLPASWQAAAGAAAILAIRQLVRAALRHPAGSTPAAHARR